MTPALAGHAHATGLKVATVALLLVILEVFLGRRLRHGKAASKTTLRRIHFWLMIVLVILIVIHVVLDSSVLGTFRP